MADEKKICPYCGVEIAPMDSHAASLQPDTIGGKAAALVRCVLQRYYVLDPKRPS